MSIDINAIIEESLELSPCCPVTGYAVILAASDYWPERSFNEIWQNCRQIAIDAARDIRAWRRGEGVDPTPAIQRLVNHLQSL